MGHPRNAAAILSALHAISGRQATISMQLAELIDHSTRPQENNLVEQLSELFQPLLKDMAEIERMTRPAQRRGQTRPAPQVIT